MKIHKKVSIIIMMILLFSCLSTVKATDLSTKEKIEFIYDEASIKDSIRRSRYILLDESAKKVGEIENKYNLKDHLQTNSIPIVVKDQKSTGSCWAFAFSSLLETSVAKQHNKTSPVYSPMHVEYKTAEMFNRSLGSGAGTRLSIAYSVSGSGPVLEEKMKFEDCYDSTINKLKASSEIGNLDIPIDARVKETVEFANIYKKEENGEIKYYSNKSCTNEYKVSSEENELEVARNNIKEHIKTYGGITADIYFGDGINTTYTTWYNSDKKSYNYNNYNYYDNDGNEKLSTHVVTIVGWDDTYSADNFNTDNKPINDGAYIALNSYGSEWGNEGYMYISYEDAFVEGRLMGIKDVIDYDNSQKDYDKIYQYDELGMNIGIPFATSTPSTDSSGKTVFSVPESVDNIPTITYMANKYKREIQTDKDEYINEIGIYISKTSGVKIYINPKSDNLNEAIEVTNNLGSSALERGYHTIKLTSPIKLEGDTFAVKVEYINAEGVQVPLEVNYQTFGSSGTSDFYNNATASDGEGFISIDGTTWYDINKSAINNGETQFSLENSSACIKAFTTLQAKATENVAVTGVQLDKTEMAIKVGESKTLTATITPENATNQKITWTSSDDSIAKVENGVVTGIKEGTATITVTTEDGAKTASCAITVEENDSGNPIAVTGVTLDKDLITLNIGGTKLLTATITPENATNKKVNWTSSDDSIAKVENGLVTGIKEGTVTITATTEDGAKTASCKVTVEENNTVPVTSIQLNKTTTEVQEGDKFNLVVTINPTNATNKNIIWSTSNAKVATVSSTGIIEALTEGTATITATTEDGNKTASCEVTVKAKTNTDDDIYTNNDEDPDIVGSQEKDNKDGTITNKSMPFTGNNITIIIVTVLGILLTIIIFIKYRSFKDIK